MSEEMQTDTPKPVPEAPEPEETTAPVVETGAPEAEAPAAVEAEAASATMEGEGSPAIEPAVAAALAAPVPATRGDRPPREPRADRPPREPRSGGPQGQAKPNDRGKAPGGDTARRGPDQRPAGNDRPRDSGPRPADRSGDRDRRPDMRRPEGPVEIEYDKVIGDSLYLDNQAHVLVARLRDLDAGTRSQLRRLYGAVRRACRAPEADRQHQFVMLRARLAYTIARHGLRSLDPLEKLLLQVTRRNETRGYDRFRDLFEAIIAYNE